MILRTVTHVTHLPCIVKLRDEVGRRAVLLPVSRISVRSRRPQMLMIPNRDRMHLLFALGLKPTQTTNSLKHSLIVLQVAHHSQQHYHSN